MTGSPSTSTRPRRPQVRFGTTVAHGFLTLSLIVHFWNDVAPPYDGVTINYGLNKVRFPAPVPSGSRIARGSG